MCMIGVLADKEEKITDFFQAEDILFFSRSENWQRVKTYKIRNKFPGDRLETNETTDEVIRVLEQEECKCLLGLQIIGIAYQLLSRVGVTLCETSEISIPLLEEVYQDFYMERPEKERTYIPPYPIRLTEDGFYFFDFDEAIKVHPHLSSKKMIIPFLKGKNFICLIIKCTHIMPWLETFTEEYGLSMEKKKETGVYTVTISHSSC